MSAHCTVGDCGGVRKARGYCDKHYRRALKHGSPHLPGRNYLDPEEAFAARIEPLVGGDCLLWMGSINWERDGYGQISDHGVLKGVHRYAWEREHGLIPDGMQVDHTCHVRTCVEISHLRLATPGQNQWNRAGADRGSASGIRNVYRAPSGRYQVLVSRGGEAHYGGMFDSAQEAEVAAINLRKTLHEEFAS